MPFYNSEDYIERAILSVIKQSYDNWELIAVNDGSQDNSFGIVKRYSKNDLRIRILSKENGGYSTAVNFGLDHLSKESDYFCILGSDDELETTALEQICNKIDGILPDLVGFVTMQINESGNKRILPSTVPYKDIYEHDTDLISFYKKHIELNQLFVVRDTSRLFKTSVLGDLRYFGKYGISADGIFSSMFAYKCSSFSHYNIVGYIWHIRNNSVSGTMNESKKLDSLSNWNEFFKYVVKNGYELTYKSSSYPKEFYNLFSYFVLSKNKIDEQVLPVLNRCQSTLKITKQRFKFSYGKMSSLVITFPRLANFLFRIKHTTKT